MMLNCVERALHAFFFKYGGLIAKNPLPFLIVPLLVAGVLGAGIVFMTSENDVEELYAPENSPAFDAQKTIKTIYKEFGDDDLLPRHLTELGLSGQVIISQRNGGNVLSVPVVGEAIRLHSTIMNISVRYNETSMSYSDLCLMWNGQCDPVGILEVFNYSTQGIAAHQLSYPIAQNYNGMQIFVGSELGGVSYEQSSGNVAEAKFIQFTYPLRYDDANEQTLGLMWEKEFLKQVKDFESDEIVVHRRASQSLEDELDDASRAVFPLFSITFTILINFSIWSSIMKDNVRSKPWLASLGVVSAGLAIISSFGLMSYIGVPYINVVGSAPFLILGIGVDDMFIMIAAWRQTDVHKKTKDRMSESFADAAMSITITSITDALAFGIGAITYFRSVRIFCMYTGVAVLFDYAYQITFFAACMALMGYREEKNLHAMTCRKVLPAEDAPSTPYRICCSGGSPSIPDEELDRRRRDGEKFITQHGVMEFFKNFFGPFITHPITAVAVVLIYCFYLGISVWGVLTLEEGLKLRNLSPDDSYAGQYYDLESKYFREYGPVVSIVITEEVDYSNADIQSELNLTLSELESSNLFHSAEFTTSWLREFQKYLVNRDSILATPVSENVSRDDFVDILKTEFLEKSAFRQFLPDIKFNSEGSIISSRFFTVSKDANTTTKERDLMLKAREIARKSVLPMIAYHPAFVFFDQYIEIRPNTLQNLGIALAAMFVIAILMVPHPLCAILVTISLVSIEVGVVGFMSHWNVALDSVSMINLILCIGFSVDFSAHIAYGFITSPGESSRERSIHALHSLGMPITQGALSTILAVVVLATSDSYIFRTFFKTMFLVIVFGALHALVFLPVFLMLLVPFRINRAVEEREERREYPSSSSRNTEFVGMKGGSEGSTDMDKGTRVEERCDDPSSSSQNDANTKFVVVADGLTDMDKGSGDIPEKA